MILIAISMSYECYYIQKYELMIEKNSEEAEEDLVLNL